jgi:cold shock CspA family protein
MSFDQTLAAHLAAESRSAPTVPTARPTTRPSRKPTKLSAPGLHLGVVNYWDDGGGWGFIRPDSPGSIGGNRDDDVFCHASAVRRSGLDTLIKNTRVAFDVGSSKLKANRLEAKNISIIIVEDQQK